MPVWIVPEKIHSLLPAHDMNLHIVFTLYLFQYITERSIYKTKFTSRPYC